MALRGCGKPSKERAWLRKIPTRERGTDLRRCGGMHNQSLAHSL